MTKARDLADMMSEGKVLNTELAAAMGMNADDTVTEVLVGSVEKIIDLEDENLLNLGVQDASRYYRFFNADCSD